MIYSLNSLQFNTEAEGLDKKETKRGRNIIGGAIMYREEAENDLVVLLFVKVNYAVLYTLLSCF